MQDGEFDTLSTRDFVPSITPFLPSNQVPGPFRPIAGNNNQLQVYNGDINQTVAVGQLQHYVHQQSNAIQAYRKLQKDHTSKPIKYTAYTNSNQQYIQLLPTTTESVIKGNHPAQFKQYYQYPLIYGTNMKSQGYATHGSEDTTLLKTNSGSNVNFNDNK